VVWSNHIPNLCLPILSTSRSESVVLESCVVSNDRRGARWSSISIRSCFVHLLRGVLVVSESVRGVGCIGFISREGSGREGNECLLTNGKGGRLSGDDWRSSFRVFERTFPSRGRSGHVTTLAAKAIISSHLFESLRKEWAIRRLRDGRSRGLAGWSCSRAFAALALELHGKQPFMIEASVLAVAEAIRRSKPGPVCDVPNSTECSTEKRATPSATQSCAASLSPSKPSFGMWPAQFDDGSGGTGLCIGDADAGPCLLRRIPANGKSSP
jgi:hypothetical protein